MEQAAPVITPKLDIPAAARFVGLAVRTLATREWRERVGIPHYRVGDRILFDVDELRAWLEQHRCG